jgi:myo-inositol 2-dehydrogenase / D-chiro-inositol 1-dehydrogenase
MSIAVGVIGTGGMGTRHAHNLHRLIKGVQVAGLYDLDQARAGRVAAECGNARVFPTPEALIDDLGIQAILIASPDTTHADLALTCIKARKPVLCEKPLGVTLAQTEAVIDAEIALGHRLLSLGFMRRFDPQHVSIKLTSDSGVIGRPVLFKGVSRNMDIEPGVPAETVLSNSVCHDLDVMRWLTGGEVSALNARAIQTDPKLGPNCPDLFVIQLELDTQHGPVLATIEAYLTAGYGYDISAELVGAHGAASTAPTGTGVLKLAQRRSDHIPAEWLERFQAAYHIEVQAWADALNGGPAFPGASAYDGYCAQRLAEACATAIKTGDTVTLAAIAPHKLYGR